MEDQYYTPPVPPLFDQQQSVKEWETTRNWHPQESFRSHQPLENPAADPYRTTEQLLRRVSQYMQVCGFFVRA